jgi:hypothetical protein
MSSIEQRIKNMNDSLEKRGAEVRAANEPNLEEMRRLNQEARDKWQAKLAADKLQREETLAASKEQLRQQEEARLRASVHHSFFASNPAASEADFERLYPKLRDERFMQRTTEEHVAAELKTGIYAELM